MHVALDHVSKRYGAVRALDDVSLTLAPGEIVAVLGVNGAGKSTLLRCLGGIVSPDRGELRMDDELFRRSRLDLRRRLLYLSDAPPLYPGWTPLRHVASVTRLYERDGPGVEARVVDALRDLDLLDLAEVPIGTLSRGQAYKTALAACFVVDPELWILDEPFGSGMDPLGLDALKRRARAAVGAGGTVVYTTQLLDVAERFADRVCVLHRGAVRALDTLPAIAARSGGEGGPLEALFLALREAPR